MDARFWKLILLRAVWFLTAAACLVAGLIIVVQNLSGGEAGTNRASQPVPIWMAIAFFVATVLFLWLFVRASRAFRRELASLDDADPSQGPNDGP